MGWLNVIIREGLYDKDFVDKWTTGFDKLAERAADYPPDVVATIAGVSVERIVESARMYAATKPASLYRGLATDQLGLNSSRVAQATADVYRQVLGS